RAFDAVERLRQNPCRRSFSNAARTNKKVRVREPVLRHGILQRARDVGLTDQIVKRLGSIFSCENLVTHLVKSRSFLKNVILSEAKHDSRRPKKRGPAGFPAGPFVNSPELSGHCHAASAGAAGAAITAARVTGRDRRRAR